MNYTHKKMTYLYIGIDTHKEKHTATFINFLNEKLLTITFNNDTKGFQYLKEKTEMLKNKLELIPFFGLEDTRHYGYGLASFLMKENYNIKYITATYTFNERKKNPIITKNDELDSSCIAKVLLDEFDNLPTARNDEIYWTLKQLVRLRDNVIKINTTLKYKLHAQLLHHYPNYKKMFYHSHCKTALKFWETYPSPNLLTNVTIEELAALNASDDWRGALGINKAKKILELVKEIEIPYQDYQEERNCVLVTLVKQIKSNTQRLEELEKDIIELYDKLDKKLHTIPLITKMYGALILAEIGNIERFDNSSKLAKYAGIAPIEKSSGNTTKAKCNKYGNRKLNSYLYVISLLGLSTGSMKDRALNPIFKEYYVKKVNNGKTPHQAIICIMRRMINIIYKVLKYDIEYETPNELLEECKRSFKDRYNQQLMEEELKKQKKSKKNVLSSLIENNT